MKAATTLYALFSHARITGLAFCDISTGELYATLLDGEAQEADIKNELLKYKPAEILIGGDAVMFTGLGLFIKDKLSSSVTMLDDEDFSYADSEKVILEQFRTDDLESLGLKDENIIDSKICSVCESKLIHSYRVEGKEAGRCTSLISLI